VCRKPLKRLARPAGLGLREPKAKQTHETGGRATERSEGARPAGLEPATLGLEGRYGPVVEAWCR
jgi:hypothetical protein